MELQTEIPKKLNIEKMITEVNGVISEHINLMLSELNEKNKDMLTTYTLLQNLPIIKNLENKLNKVNEDLDLLKSGFAFFKNGFNENAKIKLNTIEINSEKSETVSLVDIENLVSAAVQKKEDSELEKYGYTPSGVYNDSDDDPIEDPEEDSLLSASGLRYIEENDLNSEQLG